MLLSALTGCSTPAPKGDWVYYPAPPAAPRAVHLKSFNSLDELVAPKARGWSALTGSIAAGAPVQSPLGIAQADSHLYITDTALHCVHDWDLATGASRRITGRGEGALQTPTAVVATPEGRIFVADTGRGDVVEFAADGSFVRAMKPRENYRPVALALRVAGELLVADAATAQVDLISLKQLEPLSIKDGDVLNSWSLSTAKGGLPMGIATHDDPIYVSDMVGGRVLVFEMPWNLRSTIAQRGDRYGDLGQPRGIALHREMLYVADPEFGYVHIFDLQGQLLMLLGGPDAGIAATPFPVGVVASEHVPSSISRLVPPEFVATSFLVVSNSVGEKRINLFAIGEGRPK